MSTRILHSIEEISSEKWNALTEPNTPFFDHEFLQAFEEGQCFGTEAGWFPRYLVIDDDNGNPIAACPLYLKTNSLGEFIFDFHWAKSYEMRGLPYYPKLVSAIPMTPATGNRILLAPGVSLPRIRAEFLSALQNLAVKENAQSMHFLYCNEHEADFLAESGFLKRHTFEFHWHNQGYKTFDDYLQNLSHKARAQTRKERAEVAESGIVIEELTGDAIKEEHIDLVYDFYEKHHREKYGSQTYLTHEFFHHIWKSMSDRILIFLARKDGLAVASSINFFKGTGLFGRYWGHSESVKHLHFEMCYYRQIEFAIARGMQKFEAGAQGEHKIKRGLIPQYTFSAHHFAHQGFHEAIGKYLISEKAHMENEMKSFAEKSPYKK